jgi:hypothetical protein
MRPRRRCWTAKTSTADCRALLTEDGCMTVNLFGRSSSYERSLKRRSPPPSAPRPCGPSSRRAKATPWCWPCASPAAQARELLPAGGVTIETRWGLPARKWLRVFKPAGLSVRAARLVAGRAEGIGLRLSTWRPHERHPAAIPGDFRQFHPRTRLPLRPPHPGRPARLAHAGRMAQRGRRDLPRRGAAHHRALLAGRKRAAPLVRLASVAMTRVPTASRWTSKRSRSGWPAAPSWTTCASTR